MMKLILIAILFCHSSFADELTMKNLHTCLHSLQKIYPDPVFHTAKTGQPRKFSGQLNGLKGVFFEDSRGDYRFVQLMSNEKNFNLLLREGEYYKVSFSKEDVIVQRTLEKDPSLAPKIIYPITYKNEFRKPLSLLIVKYSDAIIKELSRSQKFKKDFKEFHPDGLREYKALNTCYMAAKLSESMGLKTSLEKLLKRLKKLTEMD